MLKEGGSRLSFLLPRFVVYFYRLSRAIFWYVLMFSIVCTRVRPINHKRPVDIITRKSPRGKQWTWYTYSWVIK